GQASPFSPINNVLSSGELVPALELRAESNVAATGSVPSTAAPSSLAATTARAGGSATVPAVTIADGATVEIDGASAQSVTFAGPTGTLKLEDSREFTGQISGLSGSDAVDLADLSYGPNTQATFLGNTTGGTLTISNGTQTTNITLVGNYLSSTWTL